MSAEAVTDTTMSSIPQTRREIMSSPQSSEFWCLYAQVYDRLVASSPGYVAMMKECVSRLNIQPGMVYLDLACGTGNAITTAFAVNQEIQFIGLDISPGMLSLARSKMDGYSSRVDLRNGDMTTRLQINDDSVDGVISVNSLYVLTPKGKGTEMLKGTIMEVHRILKADGRFVISVPREGFGWIQYIQGVLEHFNLSVRQMGLLNTLKGTFQTISAKGAVGIVNRANEIIMDSYSFLSSLQYRKILEECGFQVEEVKPTYTGNSLIVAVKS